MNSESDSTGGMESESTLDIIGHRVSFYVIKISFENSSTFPPNRALSSPSPSHLTVRGSPLVLKTGAYISGAHAQGKCSASVGLFQPSIYLPMVETALRMSRRLGRGSMVILSISTLTSVVPAIQLHHDVITCFYRINNRLILVTKKFITSSASDNFLCQTFQSRAEIR